MAIGSVRDLVAQGEAARAATEERLHKREGLEATVPHA